MDKLKAIFKWIREDFKAAVPPLEATVDQEHHYEVQASYLGKENFFGKVVLHEDYVEVAFFPYISHDIQKSFYPSEIFEMTDETFHCKISNLSPELRENIKELIHDMIDYFRMAGYLGPEK